MKTTFLDKIEQFSYKIGQQKHIIALRDGGSII